jgi:hypothetical protein
LPSNWEAFMLSKTEAAFVVISFVPVFALFAVVLFW